MLGAFGIATFFSLSYTIAEIDLLMRIERGVVVSDETLTKSDDRQSTVAMLTLLAFAGTVVAFCIWIYRASKNLGALGIAGQKFSPGASVGCWFIPLLMLFVPYLVMKEIWRGSRPDAARHTEDAWKKTPVSPLMGWWWATWISGSFVASAGYQIFDDGETISELLRADWLIIAGNSLLLLSGIFVFALVWQISSNQDKSCVRLQIRKGSSHP